MMLRISQPRNIRDASRSRKSARVDSHHQLAFAAQRLRRCLEEHSRMPSTPPRMLTRLLHIQVVDGAYAICIATEVSPQPYVTLSHC